MPGPELLEADRRQPARAELQLLIFKTRAAPKMRLETESHFTFKQYRCCSAQTQPSDRTGLEKSLRHIFSSRYYIIYIHYTSCQVLIQRLRLDPSFVDM